MTDPINWSLHQCELKQLKPLANNPRIISKSQFKELQKSIEKFGFIDKPILNADHRVIAGNQRVKAWKKLKNTICLCWMPDRQLTDEEVNELAIRHNRNHGSWDFDSLANNFEVDDLLQWGFSAEELYDEFGEEEKPKEKKAKKTVICPNCSEEFVP